MGAFILALLIVLATVLWCGFELFAAGMSSSPSASAEMSRRVPRHFAVGLVLAGLVAATHWLPSIGW